jgi:hypothetical protein
LRRTRGGKHPRFNGLLCLRGSGAGGFWISDLKKLEPTACRARYAGSRSQGTITSLNAPSALVKPFGSIFAVKRSGDWRW